MSREPPVPAPQSNAVASPPPDTLSREPACRSTVLPEIVTFLSGGVFRSYNVVLSTLRSPKYQVAPLRTRPIGMSWPSAATEVREPAAKVTDPAAPASSEIAPSGAGTMPACTICGAEMVRLPPADNGTADWVQLARIVTDVVLLMVNAPNVVG